MVLWERTWFHRKHQPKRTRALVWWWHGTALKGTGSTKLSYVITTHDGPSGIETALQHARLSVTTAAPPLSPRRGVCPGLRFAHHCWKMHSRVPYAIDSSACGGGRARSTATSILGRSIPGRVGEGARCAPPPPPRSRRSRRGARLEQAVPRLASHVAGGFIHPSLACVEAAPCGARGIVAVEPLTLEDAAAAPVVAVPERLLLSHDAALAQLRSLIAEADPRERRQERHRGWLARLAGGGAAAAARVDPVMMLGMMLAHERRKGACGRAVVRVCVRESREGGGLSVRGIWAACGALRAWWGDTGFNAVGGGLLKEGGGDSATQPASRKAQQHSTAQPQSPAAQPSPAQPQSPATQPRTAGRVHDTTSCVHTRSCDSATPPCCVATPLHRVRWVQGRRRSGRPTCAACPRSRPPRGPWTQLSSRKL